MLPSDIDQAHLWRELERIEQRLSKGADAAISRLYDTMGRPAAQTFTNYGNHLAAGIARVERVRQALEQSGPMARRLVEQQLSGIGISAVWDILIAACKEIALYYGGAVVTGTVVGGAIGSVAFGVGALPGAMIGTAAGAQVGTWVMAMLGLKGLIEGFGHMLPAALDHYERGFREAWGASSEERSNTWKSTAAASGNSYTGTWYIAQGHVIMVTAVLTALVAYLTRGRGNNALLMQEIGKSPRLGTKFVEWLLKNEGKLLSHPKLRDQSNASTGIALGKFVPTDVRGASAPKAMGKVSVGPIKTLSPTIASNPATGNPAAIARGIGELNSRQLAVLNELPEYGSKMIVHKSFGQRDLSALTAATGDEFAMFSTGGRRLIYRGDATSVPITPEIAHDLAEQGWRWSSHVHPGYDTGVLRSSLGDQAVLKAMGGSQSAIYNSIGQRSIFTPAGDSLNGWMPW